MVAPPVKLLAQEEGIPVYQPQKVKSGEAIERIAALAPTCIVVVAYGQLLPAEILALPQLGTVNVHASLTKISGTGAYSLGLDPGRRKNRDYYNAHGHRYGYR
jgi:hypothetical protein